jgi:hypothetical protein
MQRSDWHHANFVFAMLLDLNVIRTTKQSLECAVLSAELLGNHWQAMKGNKKKRKIVTNRNMGKSCLYFLVRSRNKKQAYINCQLTLRDKIVKKLYLPAKPLSKISC